MEDPSAVESQEIVCRQCGSGNVEENYLYPLCHQCRDELTRRPIPFGIKLAGIVILAVLAFALMRFPLVLETGIAYERGREAEREFKYITAMTNYKKVYQAMPDSTLVSSRLFIVDYKSGHVKDAMQMVEVLKNKSYSDNDQELLTEVKTVFDELIACYIPPGGLRADFKTLEKATDERKVEILQGYLDINPENEFANMVMADALFNLKRYDEAKDCIDHIMAKHPDYNPGLLFLAAICREKSDYEQALTYCKKALANNLEDAHAYSSTSKIELKRKNDRVGLSFAQRAYRLDPDDPSVLANLALAYHYNDLLKKRDEVWKSLQKNYQNEYDEKLLTEIFNGELDWRE